MAENWKAGACHACHGWVAAGEGRRVRESGRWVTVHPGCVPVRVAPPAGDHDGWHRGPLAALDLETTGVDPVRDRIVTAAVVAVDGRVTGWLVDPGVPIPAEATVMHGISTEHARAHGRAPVQVLPALAAAVDAAVRGGVPLVVYNAPYDLTLLGCELARYGVPAPRWDGLLVVDPLVLDRQVDRYRPGGRKLTDLCAFYEVEFGGAHSAEGDAVAALRLARSIGARYPALAGMDPSALHAAQVAWQAEQAAGLQAYYRRRGVEETVEVGWPRRPVALAGGG